MILEFIGCVFIIVILDVFDKEVLIKILIEFKNVFVKQYQKFFVMDGVELEFEKDVLEVIVDKVIECNIGVRGFRVIMEEIMFDVMFEILLNDKIEKVIIIKAVVLKEDKFIVIINENKKVQKKLRLRQCF